MHARSIVQVFSFALIVAVGVVWMKSRGTAADLQARLSTVTTFRRNTARALEQERDRLRSELVEANRRRQAEATATPPASVLPSPPVKIAPWSLGVWRSPREWRNEGQSTPRATVDTLLWAAAGGDMTAMMSLITFDEASRSRAQALFDTLPPAARLAFPTPQALVAGLTIQAVPASTAQLSWFHQRDDDHATVGVFLGAPDESAPTAPDKNSLGTNDPHVNKLTILSLQRSARGWRVAVPAAAIDFLARQSQSNLMTGLDSRK